MTDGDDDPVARPDGLPDGFPKFGVEGAAAHAAESLVFDRYTVLVEVVVGIVSPSPLSVVAVAERTVAHGGVADKEEHGVVVYPTRPWYGSCCLRLGKRVERKVLDFVHILERSLHLCLGGREGEEKAKCRYDSFHVAV